MTKAAAQLKGIEEGLHETGTKCVVKFNVNKYKVIHTEKNPTFWTSHKMMVSCIHHHLARVRLSLITLLTAWIMIDWIASAIKRSVHCLVVVRKVKGMPEKNNREQTRKH